MLGGGLSWLARKHGLAANNVLAIELVTADGGSSAPTHDDHPTCSGRSAAAAATTASSPPRVRALPSAEVYAGMMIWPWERAAEVLKAWVEWTRTAPDEVTTTPACCRSRRSRTSPSSCAGRRSWPSTAPTSATRRAARSCSPPLRELGPEMDTFGPMAPGGAVLHPHGPRGPIPGLGDHTLLGDLADEAIDALVAPPARLGLAAARVELRHLGGALGRPGAGHGALDVMPGAYAMFAVGMPMTPELGAAVQATAGGDRRDGDVGRRHGVPQLRRGQADPARFYSAANYARLRRVKAEVDPTACSAATTQSPRTEAEIPACSAEPVL